MDRSFWEGMLISKPENMYQGLVVCVGLAGLFAGFSPLFHIPAPLQWLLVLGAVISGVLAVFTDIRLGTKPLIAVLKVVGVCILVGGFLFGLSRYFASLATSGEPLFTLQ